MTRIYSHLQVMNTFTEKNLPGLSMTTLGALELFAKEGIPKINFPKFKKPKLERTDSQQRHNPHQNQWQLHQLDANPAGNHLR